jgi:hypothetical protein
MTNESPFRRYGSQKGSDRMHWKMALAVAGSLIAGVAGGAAFQTTTATLPPPPPSVACGDASAAQLRTTLYFSTTRPTGEVSELEWQLFLRDEVTTRFPDGLTVWDAQGQWKNASGRIAHDSSKILLVVHPDTAKARTSIQEVIETYRKMFEQESVMRETAIVCVSF